MKRILLFLTAWILLYPVFGQRTLEWSVGPPQITCEPTLKICYPLRVAITDASQTPALGFSTIRFFFDRAYLNNLTAENVENGYTVTNLSTSIPNASFGTGFGFLGGQGSYAQLSLNANTNDLIALSTTPVHVMDLCFDIIKPGAVFPLCAPFVFDNNSCGWDQGNANDNSFILGSAGLVGLYYLNNVTTTTFIADDEVTNYLWTPSPSFDCLFNTPGEIVGTTSSTGCLESVCIPSIDIAKTASSPTYNAVDQVITYTFTVQNTSNVTLTNVSVTDPLPGLSPVSPASIATLAPGATQIFTATYTTTQANLDAGSIVNTATVTGTYSGSPVTDTDGETITAVQTPSIAIVKMGTFVDNAPMGANPGDVITYAFTVTNTGNVTLTNVTVTDPLVTVVGGPIASLAPGASNSTTFTASYVITQADINTGRVTNQATATGTPPTGPNVTDLSDDTSPLQNDPTITIIPNAPSISIIKTGVLNTNVVAPNGVANPGDVITYAFTVTNTGNVTLTNVTVTDPLVTVVGGPIASLAPGASDNTTFTASYVITQADINTGGVTNQATATGTPPTGPNVTDLSDNNSPLENDPTVTPIPQNPSITIVKTGVLNMNVVAPNGVANPGDVITYAFTVTNTGNVPLTNVTVTDPLVTVVGGPITLAPGASDNTTFTASYVITQANINAGGVTNQATATGTPPTGPNVTDLSDNNSPLENDPTVTPIPQNPSIAIVKTGVLNTNVVSPSGVANPGDVITYAFTVTNTGNVPLTNVTVTDPLVTVVGGPIASLAPGASNSTTFTASYIITQANINAGGVTNQATATGTPPTGPNVTDLSDNNSPLENDPTVTPIPQNPSIAIVKTGTFVDNAPTGANPGDLITYAFTVTNTGNVTLTNVTVTDPLVTVVGGPIASLAPGASNSTTFTASYVITQADINTGRVTNQATATGTPPTGPNVTDLSDNNSPLENDPTVTPIPQNPSIAIVKTGVLNTNVVAPNGVANPGDVITYAFTVTNTGNVTLTNVTITDPLVTVVGGPIASLAPGASDNTTFTASYVITQADINTGGVTNQATATGTPPTGPNVTDLSDDNSPLQNDPTVTPIPQNPSIAIVKTGVLNTNVVSPSGVANPGDVITYAFTVTNTGNVPLTNVTVTDPLVTVVGGPITLAPGASNSTSFTASYTITQANINAGGVTNQATATGTPPTGPNVTDLSDNNSPLENDPTVTPIPQNPSIAIVKTGVLNTNVVAPNGVANPGDVITYAFTVTNTGNVPLTNVTVTDPLVTVVGGPIASLAPGASNSTTFTASYVITQANINAGGVSNQATATGTPPTGPNVTDLSDDNSPLQNDPTVTPIPRNPSIAIVKTGTFVDNAPAGANPGDLITYAFTVTNTGNVTLTNVTVTDPLVTVIGGPIASLAPGASDNTTFTASYVITQADINTGGVSNQATATGTPPTGPNVTDLSDDNSPLQNDPTITTIPQNPSIAIVKTGVLNTNVVSPNGVANPGDVITYAFTVTNTGNVPLTNVTVTDPLVTVVGGPISLAPGASNSTSFTASYTITQANINTGGVTNQATATGTPPTGPNVTDLSDNNSPLENDPTVTPIPQNPSIAIVKTGVLNTNVVAPNGVANPGDVITYAFTVTNTGNVPLTNVTVTDPLVTVVGGPIASLAPGASNSTTFTASYVITQANINAGGVSNQATATGTPPTGPNVTDLSDDNSPLQNDPTVTPIPRNPSIAIVKTGTFVDNAPTGANPGDLITYAFTVTNTGNVTLTNVTVTDPLVTVVGGPIASLAPGASDNTTFTASYVITQADINTGGVTNQATATGTPPSGPNVTDLSDDNSPLQNDPTITTIPNAASIAIIKTGVLNTNVVAPNGVANPGDVITYAFTVTNTGNVTLTNVTVTDPLVTVVGGPIASLAPGASNSTTFTASYVITQANITAGGVTNQATATGTPPTGPNVTDLSDNNSPLENDPTVTPIPQNPSIAIVKTGVLNTNVVSPSGVANPGDVITYAFTVTNTGNVPLTNVTVTDPLVTVIGGPIASLAPGASNSTTFTASYVITQADINTGGVTNQATATGTPPTGPNVTDLSDNNSPLENDPTVTPIPQNPSIAIVKTGVLNTNVVAPNGVANPGDVITYAFTVTNTGNVTLTNVTVTDPQVTVVGGPIASLAPGASDNTSFTASYVITQANINAGGVTNQATATGTPPTGPNVTDLSDDNSPLQNDPTVTPIPRNPSIAIVKTGTFVDNAPTGANPGDLITYAFTVTNTGNVTLTNVTVTDPLVTVVGGPIASLAPGASDNTTFTASYVITQANINAGGVTNQATATGTPPTGPNVTDLSDDNSPLQNDPTVTPIPRNASIAIVKTGVLNTNVVAPNGVANPGDVITYAFTVTNTGNVTLTNVTVTDPLVTVVGGPIASLAPGASNSTTFTASYVITQADITAGGVTNQATATGTPPTGPNVTDLSDNNSPFEDDPTVTPIPQNPSIAIVKTGVLNTNVVAPNGVANPGDVITYAFTVTNTGNVPLTNVTVTDPLVTVVGGPIASLAPGASNSTTFTASYVITQANINAGGVTNQATATGTPPTGPNVTDLSDNNSPLENDPTVTPLPQTPSLSVIKSATGTVGSNGFITKVLYSIVVTNTGNVTVSNIDVVDNNGTITGGTNPIPSLLPGASASFTAEHIVTSADVTAGYVQNTATATGDSPLGTDNVTDVSDAGTFKNTTPISNPEGTETPNGLGAVDGNPTNDPTVYNLCVDWNVFVYLEGSLVVPQTGAYQAPPMRTTLNSSLLLPGQFQANLFGGGGVYTPPLGTNGQVYNIAPWNYSGAEGNAYDSGGNPVNASAGYAPQVVDWVLVSLRRSPENGSEKICQRVGLLYSDGRIEFTSGTNCCALDPTESFYVVIEHRNHLLVMSHAAVPVVNGALNYDFRNKQSYLVDPLNVGTYYGQTQISTGVFAMHAGNGEQAFGMNDDVDINAADIAKWINNGAQQRTYNILDFNMDGEVSSLDFDLWERNATKFSSVPRN